MNSTIRIRRRARRRLFQWLSGPITKAAPMKAHALRTKSGTSEKRKAKLAGPITIAPVLFLGGDIQS